MFRSFGESRADACNDVPDASDGLVGETQACLVDAAKVVLSELRTDLGRDDRSAGAAALRLADLGAVGGFGHV